MNDPSCTEVRRILDDFTRRWLAKPCGFPPVDSLPRNKRKRVERRLRAKAV